MRESSIVWGDGVDLLNRLKDPFAAGTRGRDKTFFQAAMASAALITAADGEVTFAKRHTLDQILDSVEALKAFEALEAVDLFDTYVAEMLAKPDQGRAKALEAVSAIAGQADSAQILLRIAAAMGRADGMLSAEVRARIGDIATVLGVPPPDLNGASDSKAAGKAGNFDPWPEGPHPSVIVLGNEKGGTGKSTTAMHLAVALLRLGHKVGTIDLDGRQATFSRYIANREALGKDSGQKIALPRHRRVMEAEMRDRDEAEQDETTRLAEAFAAMADCQFLVIDTPGSKSHLSHLAHAQADILITPLNDSFLDIDVLARIDRVRREVLEPSPYSNMIREQNDHRVATGQGPIDWIVMRNRLAHIDAHNTREMAGLLQQLSKRMDFRLEPGFSERVVFRELFYRGLTLLDLPEDSADGRVNSSRQHARREVEDLLQALSVPALQAASGQGAQRALQDA